MPGSEVEDFAQSSVEAATASEDFASLEPADEDKFVGAWYVEEFPLHLGVLNLKVVADAFSDWMTWGYRPYAFLLACFPPSETTAGPE